MPLLAIRVQALCSLFLDRPCDIPAAPAPCEQQADAFPHSPRPIILPAALPPSASARHRLHRRKCGSRRHSLGRPSLPPRSPYRSEEHTSELQSLMRISYAVFCLKKKTNKQQSNNKPTSMTQKKT